MVIGTLQREFKVLTLRRKFSELDYQIEEETGKLLVEGKEIGLVYFRTGYQEEQYDIQGKDYWGLRYDLERSLAIKLPSIDT